MPLSLRFMKSPKALKSNSKNGFTIIEITIVIAIMAAIFGFTAVFGMSFYRQYSFFSEKNNLVAILRKARSRAMSNINQSAHGIYIGSSQYVLFQGSSYASRDSQFDQIFDKSKAVSASGLNEAVFSPSRGDSSASGTIILTDINAGRTRAIEINYEGRIKVQ
ncbi:MAG: hypothetical protein UT92_C0001G0047 [Candidatus Curtissbacteria bacterium GW2011_GWA1_40_24]|uniref:Prepilin-type N-terminal cleavage/methylation domain-containing protein n=2 Tax=Patescibacteria group TaxID=1783273 RepID=A0A0G0RSR1_9BACT|nr:MAG: hypothetical protein UT92_C0001G0047 [Candidatus Curtissbacteria bacterium GW2011_GWA1_40_24]KKR89044.1 MAG: hypothetical protein UU38_C0002G0047 [Candidatus Wolfebacteria bacterium GW2011_GWB1_41_12]